MASSKWKALHPWKDYKQWLNKWYGVVCASGTS